jgi:hypothetical protein
VLARATRRSAHRERRADDEVDLARDAAPEAAAEAPGRPQRPAASRRRIAATNRPQNLPGPNVPSEPYAFEGLPKNGAGSGTSTPRSAPSVSPPAVARRAAYSGVGDRAREWRGRRRLDGGRDRASVLRDVAVHGHARADRPHGRLRVGGGREPERGGKRVGEGGDNARSYGHGGAADGMGDLRSRQLDALHMVRSASAIRVPTRRTGPVGRSGVQIRGPRPMTGGQRPLP